MGLSLGERRQRTRREYCDSEFSNSDASDNLADITYLVAEFSLI